MVVRYKTFAYTLHYYKINTWYMIITTYNYIKNGKTINIYIYIITPSNSTTSCRRCPWLRRQAGRAESLSVQLLLADLGVGDAGVHETNGPDVLRCNGMGWSPSNNSDLNNTWDDGIWWENWFRTSFAMVYGWYMLIYVDICWYMLICVDICWYVLIYVDICWYVVIIGGPLPGK